MKKRPKADEYDEDDRSELIGVGSYSLNRENIRGVKDKKIIGFVRPRHKKKRRMKHEVN